MSIKLRARNKPRFAKCCFWSSWFLVELSRLLLPSQQRDPGDKMTTMLALCHSCNIIEAEDNSCNLHETEESGSFEFATPLNLLSSSRSDAANDVSVDVTEGLGFDQQATDTRQAGHEQQAATTALNLPEASIGLSSRSALFPSAASLPGKHRGHLSGGHSFDGGSNSTSSTPLFPTSRSLSIAIPSQQLSASPSCRIPVSKLRRAKFQEEKKSQADESSQPLPPWGEWNKNKTVYTSWKRYTDLFEKEKERMAAANSKSDDFSLASSPTLCPSIDSPASSFDDNAQVMVGRGRAGRNAALKRMLLERGIESRSAQAEAGCMLCEVGLEHEHKPQTDNAEDKHDDQKDDVSEGSNSMVDGCEPLVDRRVYMATSRMAANSEGPVQHGPENPVGTSAEDKFQQGASHLSSLVRSASVDTSFTLMAHSFLTDGGQFIYEAKEVGLARLHSAAAEECPSGISLGRAVTSLSHGSNNMLRHISESGEVLCQFIQENEVSAVLGGTCPLPGESLGVKSPAEEVLSVKDTRRSREDEGQVTLNKKTTSSSIRQAQEEKSPECNRSTLPDTNADSENATCGEYPVPCAKENGQHGRQLSGSNASQSEVSDDASSGTRDDASSIPRATTSSCNSFAAFSRTTGGSGSLDQINLMESFLENGCLAQERDQEESSIRSASFLRQEVEANKSIAKRRAVSGDLLQGEGHGNDKVLLGRSRGQVVKAFKQSISRIKLPRLTPILRRIWG